MKKYLTTLAICLLSFTLILSGCTPAPLENAPTQTSKTCVYGSALVYKDYIYYANSYVDVSTITTKGGNINVANPAIYRIATDNNKITKNTETNLPENQEKAIAKIAGSNYSIMFSSGEYIYFSSPSIHEDSGLNVLSTYNSYFVVKTDGTGLKEFYFTNAVVTQQSILTIDGKNYLVLVDSYKKDGTDIKKLVRIELNGNNTSAVVLAEEFSSVMFANSVINANDKYAFYLTDKNSEGETSTSGNYLYKVDITSTSDSITCLNNLTPSTITLKQLYNGKIYFTMTENSNEWYCKLDASQTGLSAKVLITVDSTITNFTAVKGTDAQEYYIITTATKTYKYTDTLKDKNSTECQFVDTAIYILFTYEGNIYYSTTDGIYKISLQTNAFTKLSDVTDFLKQGISFDKEHIYLFAKNTDNTSGTYYMHRIKTNSGVVNLELVSLVLDADKPNIEDTEE